MFDMLYLICAHNCHLSLLKVSQITCFFLSLNILFFVHQRDNNPKDFDHVWFSCCLVLRRGSVWGRGGVGGGLVMELAVIYRVLMWSDFETGDLIGPAAVALVCGCFLCKPASLFVSYAPFISSPAKATDFMYILGAPVHDGSSVLDNFVK